MAHAGRMVLLPLLNREIPLVADEWAKPELGSGCVKITPAHDPNDYEVGKRQSLPMINILNPDGTLNENAGAVQRTDDQESPRAQVVADLEAQGLLERREDREIDLAHSDRSKTPIEPYLADQWFVKMSDQEDDRPGLAQMAMDAVIDGRVQVFPSRYAKSYLDWLSEKRDWPVSRQLWWGHRIPVWTQMRELEPSTRTLLQEAEAAVREFAAEFPDEQSNPEYRKYEQFFEATTNAKIKEIQERFGEDVSVHVRPDTLSGNVMEFVCVPPGREDIEQRLEDSGYIQDPDVLDTWFSSALWPHSTLGWPGPAIAGDDPNKRARTGKSCVTFIPRACWSPRATLSRCGSRGWC